MHFNSIDLSGQKFGKLTAIKQSDKRNEYGAVYWVCMCDCGNEKLVTTTHLRLGLVKGCGCDRYLKVASKVTHHGHASGGKLSGIYISWAQMHARCRNPNHNRYHRYGGRGISVCKNWDKFEGFLEDMGGSWEKGLSIDRIDNDGNYEKSNCKWSTPKEQANNRCTNKIRMKA